MFCANQTLGKALKWTTKQMVGETYVQVRLPAPTYLTCTENLRTGQSTSEAESSAMETIRGLRCGGNYLGGWWQGDLAINTNAETLDGFACESTTLHWCRLDRG